MRPRLYRFHCVGPSADAVFDLRGKRASTLTQIRVHADRVALGLMERGRTNWRRWIVDVHDATGRRVMIRAFTACRCRAK